MISLDINEVDVIIFDFDGVLTDNFVYLNDSGEESVKCSRSDGLAFMARRFGEKFRLLYDKTHISLFSDFSLRDLLQDSGLHVDKIDYPYFETEYFNKENINRVFDISKISPAFYGNFMTLYATKK